MYGMNIFVETNLLSYPVSSQAYSKSSSFMGVHPLLLFLSQEPNMLIHERCYWLLYV